MTAPGAAIKVLSFLLIAGALSFLAPCVSQAGQADPCTGGILTRGGLIVVSKECADEVRKDNSVILFNVAIKARLDKKGELRGYEAVEIDKGSAVERMGFRPHDLLVSVNGIPARDLNARREVLESTDRFDLTALRRGRTVRLRIEVR